jgi:hypothetical protein
MGNPKEAATMEKPCAQSLRLAEDYPNGLTLVRPTKSINRLGTRDPQDRMTLEVVAVEIAEGVAVAAEARIQ